LDVAEVGSHVAGGDSVGKEDNLFITQSLWHVKAVVIGIGHAYILCMCSCVSSEGMRVAVDASSRIAEDWCLEFRIGIRVVAERVEIVLAIPAGSADDERGNDDAVASLHFLDFWTNLHDLTHELMTDNVSVAHRWEIAIDEVEVRAACCRHCDLQDGIMWIHDFRIRHRLYTKIIDPIPA
jgi:hypothetical protein